MASILDEEVIFSAAKELADPAAVAAYLDAVCANNPEVRRRVERLLSLEAQARDVFQPHAAAGLARAEWSKAKATDRATTEDTVLTDPNEAPQLDANGHSRIGDYELLEEIARGGMGVVYKARQVSLDRLVAVKMLLFGSLAGADLIQRFRVEASAAASLRHPNIVTVHEVGVHGDQHYLVMDYIAGPTLAKFCAGQPLPPKRAAAYVKTIAEAIHFAHERGVLHRDLKPSNVLIDQDDQPHVTDFGLAKRLDAGDDLTLSGQIMGSPGYMAPEQAGGRRGQVGRFTDVYSLGAILFHLLTGRPPFMAETIGDTIRMVLEQEPITPRSLVMGIPRDLDTICLKCLRKEPGKRYATARELAVELGRFLNGEPIQARRASRAEKLWRWCRRRPTFASLGAATIALALAIMIGSPVAVYRINRAREAETVARTRAEHTLYVTDMELAQRAWEQNDARRVQELLTETCTNAERGFEWYFWQRQMHLELFTLRGHLGAVNSVAFSPDGRWIVTGGADGVAKVWDATSGRELRTLRGHLGRISGVAFSPDGQRIATSGDNWRTGIWDAASGRLLLSFRSSNPQCVAFSPDGRRIAIGHADHTATVRDADTGKRLVTLPGHKELVYAVAFSPDGQRIATCSKDGTSKVWDADTGKELLSLERHGAEVNNVAFSPDGRRIVTVGDDHNARVWDAASGVELLIFQKHSDGVNGVAFSPDGQRIATGSVDRTTRIWEAANGRELLTLKGHGDSMLAVGFSPDGRRIVTGSGDWTSPGDDWAKVWDAFNSREVLTFEGHSNVNAVAFSPDGRWIVTGGDDRTARVWEAAGGKELLTLKGHGERVTSVAFSHDSQRIATGSDDKTAKIWEAATGKELFTLKGHDGQVWAVGFSPDGRCIATGSFDKTARLWDASTGRQLRTFEGHKHWVWSLAFSPDGQRIVTGSWDRTAKVWEAATGKELLTLNADKMGVICVAFSPDGRRIITGGSDHTAKVWETATGKELLTLKGHNQQVWAVAYSPDGRRIVTASNQDLKVWEAASGIELLTLRGHSAATRGIAISPDGWQIATASWDHTAKVWTAATPQQVALWEREDKDARQGLAARAREQGDESASAERDRIQRARDAGAIKEWLMLGPIGSESGGAAGSRVEWLAQEQFPHEASLQPRAGDRVKVGASELVWTEVRMEDYLLDLNSLLKGAPRGGVVYAVSYIQSEAVQTGLLMKLGLLFGARVFLNGKQIYQDDEGVDYVPDAVVRGGVELKHGMNVLIFKLMKGPEGGKGSVRFTDADGQPVKGIRVTLTPP